jgi:hypothetical protein
MTGNGDVIGLFGALIALCLAAFPVGSVTTRDLTASVKATKSTPNQQYLREQLFGDEPNGVDTLGELASDTDQFNEILAVFKTKGLQRHRGATVSAGKIQFKNTDKVSIVWVFEAGESLNWLSIGLVNSANVASFLSEPLLSVVLREREELLSFDFGAYTLGQLGRAFGLRTDIGGCGAGGSLCSTTYLRLFIPQKGKLSMPFNEAIAYYGNYGGSWNKDGTRQHEVEEQNGIIVFDSTKAKGIPYISLKVKTGKNWSVRLFKSAVDSFGVVRYITSDPPILNDVSER